MQGGDTFPNWASCLRSGTRKADRKGGDPNETITNESTFGVGNIQTVRVLTLNMALCYLEALGKLGKGIKLANLLN
jgi:hypothetical protein